MGRPVPLEVGGASAAAVAAQHRSARVHQGGQGTSGAKVVTAAEKWCESHKLVDPVLGGACPFAIVAAVQGRGEVGAGNVMPGRVRELANLKRAAFELPLIPDSERQAA